jgi:hypothetical protein
MHEAGHRQSHSSIEQRASWRIRSSEDACHLATEPSTNREARGSRCPPDHKDLRVRPTQQRWLLRRDKMLCMGLDTKQTANPLNRKPPSASRALRTLNIFHLSFCWIYTSTNQSPSNLRVQQSASFLSVVQPSCRWWRHGPLGYSAIASRYWPQTTAITPVVERPASSSRRHLR